ncbi:hypothetical protein [Rhizobium ruizarguesonis]|uniref:hypothetical protein n=2 Tax=Rhizobium ruizarguesonis TaxID=2081791 RepID=UPI0010303BF4|nr:hypothetical protein [Rhizobium ruizarguesonis]TAT78354.1 hypothetical protein ELI56_09185 [Rhizobium ruizarguesonis]TAT88274.1 hypothetical protein ELI54_08690 [Rhizobium ruizarguesonis]TAY79072.1 hypothetical protein ELH86_08995 [Rhizobium ruizarguesonis]TAZ34744.1 hypothetical protein ELH80_10335 [Rhizobium ruizarguesonis]TAZ72464.1 hypothetical protein ELH70_07075 [Rhizobium ruizarguesonis]
MSRFLIGSMVLAFIADMVLNIMLWLGGLDTVVSVSSGALEIFARIMGEVLVFWFFAFAAGFVFFWAGRKSPVPVLSIVASFLSVSIMVTAALIGAYHPSEKHPKINSDLLGRALT